MRQWQAVGGWFALGVAALGLLAVSAAVAPLVRDRAVPIVGGIEAAVARNHPAGRRPFLRSAEELEDFWWTDFEKYLSVPKQRFVYQCHALYCRRTPQAAYDRMLALSGEALRNLHADAARASTRNGGGSA